VSATGGTCPGGGPLDAADACTRDTALTANYARQPVAFVRGEGARLWDAEGHEYLDLQTGLAVNSVGHCHPAVVEAIREQAAQLIHVGNLFYTQPMVALSHRLADIGGLGDGTRVFFTNSGAEAVEAALKCARKRRRAGTIVSVQRGFHGRTYGALSATPQESKQAPFAPLVPGFVAVEPTAEAITAAVDGQTAAVILEPVQGESGVYPLPAEVLRAAREACDAHGAALIFDEIQCGLGRTGDLWGWQDSGVVPDAMTVAKALAGGLPIGALVAGPAMADVFAPGDHGSTFAGGPVQCAAALAVLDVVTDPALLARVRETGETLHARLGELPGAREVRGRGYMQAVELDGVDAMALVGRAMREQRLVLNATGPTTLRLLPPLTIEPAQLDDAVDRLTRLLDA
jgi:acetylornithine/N-succinyldiaminopimelate aminotransferase